MTLHFEVDSVLAFKLLGDNSIGMTLAPHRNGNQRAPEPAIAARTVAEFFSGIGLVRLALERRNWSVVFANDNDPQKAEMYRENFGGEHLSTADIREVSPSEIPDCTLFTASFPCNDLSIAGAKAGLNGEQSSMFWHFVRILRERESRKPPLILLENVVGFLTSHGGRDFQAAMLALNELGYVVDSLILNAANFAPQSRPRLFIVAKQHRLHSPETPAPSGARPVALTSFIDSHPEVAWDIRPLPEPPAPSHTLTDIIEHIPSDDSMWWDEGRAAYFMGQLSERHLAVAKRMIAGPKYTYGTAFRRVRKGRSMAELRTDGIAGCLRTPRGGSGRQILFKAGRGKYWVRLMSARECARLQGVPDTYKINVPLNRALFGFGDAVCVPAIEWIVDNYLNPSATAMQSAPQRNGKRRR